MQLDLSQDYLSWDNTEAVQYASVRNTDTMYDVIPMVRRRMLSAKELAASGGAYIGGDSAFLIPTPLLAALLAQERQPKPGDQILDAGGQTWTVLGAQGQKQDRTAYQTWKCVCRNLAIVYDLQDLIDIQRATITYDAGGGKVKTWPSDGGGSTPYPSLPARVQLLTDEVVEERGMRGFRGTHAVIVSKQLSVTYEDRIKWGSVYLDIVGYHNPERIDELPVIDAMLPP
jgi:head-tail adaptor